MNWLLRKLGYRDSQFRGTDFSVRIEPLGREAVGVVYTGRGTNLNLDGQRIGDRWQGIEVYLPPELEAELSSQISGDLETAFQAMEYGYVIARLSAIETVSETERQQAMAELREMGHDIEVSDDGKQIRENWIAGTPKLGLAAWRKTMPRYLSLIQAVQGKRKHFQILARSKEFTP